MQTPPDAPNEQLPTDDPLLNELAAVTGLFNPEKIWQGEEKLDALDEKPLTGSHPTAEPLPAAE